MAGIKMKYNGRGFVHGVPSRDLSELEVKIFGIDRLRASGLYEEIKPKKSKTKPAASVYEDEVNLLSQEIATIESTFEEV